jgi:hypothetical protein
MTQEPPVHEFPQLSLQLLPQTPLGVQQAPVVQRFPQLSRHSDGVHAPPSGMQPPPESGTQEPPLHGVPQLSWQLAPQTPVEVQHEPPVHGFPQLSWQAALQVPSGVQPLTQAPPSHALPQLSMQMLKQVVATQPQEPPSHPFPQLSLHSLLQEPLGTQTQEPPEQTFPQLSMQLLGHVFSGTHPSLCASLWWASATFASFASVPGDESVASGVVASSPVGPVSATVESCPESGVGFVWSGTPESPAGGGPESSLPAGVLDEEQPPATARMTAMPTDRK